jgi:ATP-binding cassette, subfamily C, bacterial CydD
LSFAHRAPIRPLPALFIALALSPKFYKLVRRLNAAYHENQQPQTDCEHLMALKSKLDIPKTTPAVLTGPPSMCFDKVICRFADDPDFAIGPVSFNPAPGSATALAGPTGSGKSKLLRLILDGGVYMGKISLNSKILSPVDKLTFISTGWANRRLSWPAA